MEVGDGGDAGEEGAEVVRGHDAEDLVGIDEAAEGDAEAVADGAAGAFGGDQVGGFDGLGLAGVAHGEGDAVGGLRHAGCFRVEQDPGVRVGLQAFDHDGGDAGLFEVQAVGVARVVGQEREVEGGEDAVGGAVLNGCRAFAFGLDLGEDAHLVEDFEGGRMNGGGAGGGAEGRAFFQDGDVDAFHGEGEGGGEADRAGSGDDHCLGHSCGVRHGVSRGKARQDRAGQETWMASPRSGWVSPGLWGRLTTKLSLPPRRRRSLLWSPK